MQTRKKVHNYMEKEIKGVTYKIYSFYVGDADFRELYEKCLARRILKIYEQEHANTLSDN